MRPWQAPCCSSCASSAPSATVGALPVVHEALSLSTGSLLVDAGLGAGVGYLVAPSAAARTMYAVGGAAATTLAGLLGLVGVLGLAYFRRR